MTDEPSDYAQEAQTMPVTAAAWQLIVHACTVTDDRAAAIDAMAEDVRRLEASGDLGQVAVVLAMTYALSTGYDELAARQVMMAADSRAMFAGIVESCLEQLAAEDDE